MCTRVNFNYQLESVYHFFILFEWRFIVFTLVVFATATAVAFVNIFCCHI